MLDWTVTEDDTPEHPHPLAPPPRRGDRRWLILIGALGLIGAGLVWAATVQQTGERDDRAVAALERHPLLPPLPALVANGSPEVEAVSAQADGALQITAVHAFMGVDGTPLRFRTRRLFGETGDLLPDPAAITATLTSPHLALSYDLDDAALMTDDLGPYLGRVVAEACAYWNCPADLILSVDFSARPGAPSVPLDRDAARPANRLFAYARTFVVLRDTLSLPRPSTQGAPADAATRAYWRNAVAAATLVQLGLLVRDQEPYGFFAPPLTHHAFYYALVLRQAARSGVEDVGWLSSDRAVPPGFEAGALWREQSSITHGPPSDEAELRAALAILNPIVGEDARLEQRLFATLSPDRTLAEWLTYAMATIGRPADETIRALAGEAASLELQALAEHDPEASTWSALLDCAGGQLIWSPTGMRLALGFSDAALAPVRVVGIRRTVLGTHLALSIGDRLALRSGRTGRLAWAAGSQVPSVVNFAGWIGDNAAYYISTPEQNGSDLEIVSPDRPSELLARLTDVYRLAPAPSGDVAFVVSTAFNDNALLDGSGLLRVVLPLNGLDVPFGVGYPPAWAPDGQRVAVLISPDSGTTWGAGLSVGILPTVTQPDFGIEIWSPARVGALAGVGPEAGQVTWSPSGDRIAVTASVRAAEGASLERGLWLLTPDGVGAIPNTATRLDLPTDATAISSLGFSPDGRYLVAIAWRFGAPTAFWFASDNGALVTRRDSVLALAWAPRGQAALALTASGPEFLSSPDAPPQPLPGTACRSVVWNPVARP
mgnify:CR=1 FL=1